MIGRTQMFDVQIVRGREPGSVYCGRPSPLGNPFRMEREEDRNAVCDAYADWFDQNLETLKPDLRKLWQKGMSDGVLLLSCWCAPKRCHLETVKQFFEDQMNVSQTDWSG